MHVSRTHRRSGCRMYTARECAHRTLYSAHEYRKRWFCAITWCFYFFHYSIFVLWVFVFFFFLQSGSTEETGSPVFPYRVARLPPPKTLQVHRAHGQRRRCGGERTRRKKHVCPRTGCVPAVRLFSDCRPKGRETIRSRRFSRKRFGLASEVNNGRRADQTIRVLGIFFAPKSTSFLIVVSILVINYIVYSFGKKSIFFGF